MPGLNASFKSTIWIDMSAELVELDFLKVKPAVEDEKTIGDSQSSDWVLYEWEFKIQDNNFMASSE